MTVKDRSGWPLIKRFETPWTICDLEDVVMQSERRTMYPELEACQLRSPQGIYGQKGDYELQIEAIKQIANFAGDHDIEITLENTNLNWDGIPDQVSGEAVNWSQRNRYFGESPEEWIQMSEDVNMPNVSLCLDSGHAATYAQIFSGHDKRTETMMCFLSRPELIGHVHWNDQFLYDLRGRPDYHGLIGTASLPIEFHRKIKSLDATLLLEHFYSIEELEKELIFIDNL